LAGCGATSPLFFYGAKDAFGALAEHVWGEIGTPAKSVVFAGEKQAGRGARAFAS
jgi:hypothetical protein